jgi:hypothetical protein
MPEVIEREIEKHGLAVGFEAVAAARKAERQLERLLDRRVSFFIPTDAVLKEGIESRLRQLEPLFERVPLTVEHVRQALDRVNAGVAPSTRRQEYKDSLIWEATLELGAQSQVYLVTEDSAFFVGEELASSLREECRQKQLSIRGFRGLEACLADLAPTAPASYSEVREKIKTSLRGWSESRLGDFGCTGKVSEELDIKLFATEDPARAAVAFTAKGDMEAGANNRWGFEGQGTFEVQASGTVDIKDGSILDLSGPGFEFLWKVPHPQEEGYQRIMASAGGGLGFVVAGPTFEAFRDTEWLRVRDSE